MKTHKLTDEGRVQVALGIVPEGATVTTSWTTYTRRGGMWMFQPSLSVQYAMGEWVAVIGGAHGSNEEYLNENYFKQLREESHDSSGGSS